MKAIQLIRTALSGKAYDYTTGNIRKGILLLAIPMMLEMAMESVFALVDTYFVGRIGVEALTTIGLTEVMMTLIYSIAIGISMAPMAMVSRYIGQKNPEMADRVAGQSFLLAVLVSALIAVPGYLYAEDLLRLMGASEAVVDQGSGYTRIMFATNGVIMLLFVLNGVFRGAGEAAAAMQVLWVANGINILLDPLFIFGIGPFPELGVTGAAVATSIGRGLGVVFQLYLLRRRAGIGVKIRLPATVVDWPILREIATIAGNGALQYLIASASWVFLMRIMAGFGAAAVAGYTVSVRLILFTLLPAWGLSNAAATFVGQNLGAGQPERAEQGVWVTLRITTVYLLLLSVGYYLLAGPLVGSFIDDASGTETGILALQIFALGYVLFGLGTIPVQAYNGAGDTRTPMFLNLLCFWAIEIPLSYYLAEVLGYGPAGVVWAIVAAEAMLAALGMGLFLRGGWKRAGPRVPG